MGVIRRQGIKNSIVSFFGIALGFISTIYIYPIDLEAKGLMDYLINLGTLFIPYAQLGVISVYNKYFKKLQLSIASFQLWVLRRILIQFSIFTVLFFILRIPLAQLLSKSGIDTLGLFLTYSYLIPILVLLILIQTFLLTLCVTNRRTAIAELIKNTVQKIYFPLIIILKFTLNFSENTFIFLIVFYYIITIPLLIIYTKKNNFLRISFRNNEKSGYPVELKKEIKTFNLFSLLNDISAQLCFKLDAIMVASIVGFSATGIFSSMVFMANAISIPSNSIMKISNPIVAAYMSEKNYKAVAELYKKVSITSLITGIGMFMLVWFLLDEILSLTKFSEQLKVGKYVFLIMGASKIIDMLTSINSDILIYSKFYKYNLIFVTFLGIGNIFFNILLIPKYGIEGAALASLIVLGSYNIIKLVFLYKKLNMHPFSSNTVKLFLIGIINAAILYMIPELSISNAYFLLITKAVMVSFALFLFFILPIYQLKLSIDFNKLIDLGINKIKKLL
jgi:O-antigen/teichoic acid export membrane protein